MEITERHDDERAIRFGVEGTGVTTDSRAPDVASGEVSRIVVGLDGSEASIGALRRAVRSRERQNTMVEALVVWDYPGFYATMSLEGWSPEEDAKNALADAVNAVFADAVPSWFIGTIRQGNPAHVLIAESRGADMLVVGSRGHGGFAGLLLGSVSMACAEHALCPVLIMHGNGAD